MGSRALPKTGRKVKVLYLPDKPPEADVKSLIRSWAFSLVGLAAAAVFLFASLPFYTNIFGQAR